MESRYDVARTWLQDATTRHPNLSGADLAKALIRDFISAQNSTIYSYDCSFNPEGLPQSCFIERELSAYHRMMASLSVLDDQEINRVLMSVQDRDFDESTFAVTSVADVKAWRDETVGRCIADVLVEEGFERAKSSQRHCG